MSLGSRPQSTKPKVVLGRVACGLALGSIAGIGVAISVPLISFIGLLLCPAAALLVLSGFNVSPANALAPGGSMRSPGITVRFANGSTQTYGYECHSEKRKEEILDGIRKSLKPGDQIASIEVG